MLTIKTSDNETITITEGIDIEVLPPIPTVIHTGVLFGLFAVLVWTAIWLGAAIVS